MAKLTQPPLSVPGGSLAGMLTVRDTMTLDLERHHWIRAGAKDARIRELFSESATRYYARLNRLIDQPEALAYDPLLVKRLQRLRDARQRARSATAQAGPA